MFTSTDVCVVIPVYNPGQYFQPALESVLREEPGQVIIVNDASTVPIPDFVYEFSAVTVLHHESNRGPGAARNTGIAQCTRPWVAFIDADDLWIEGKLALQLRLAQERQADVVVGVTEFIGPEGGPDPKRQAPRHIPGMGTMLLRREVAQKIPEDETSNLSEDLDFYLQIKEAGLKLHLHDDIIYRYRRGIESLTSELTLEEKKQSLFRTLSRSLARRRAAPTSSKETSHEISAP